MGDAETGASTDASFRGRLEHVDLEGGFWRLQLDEPTADGTESVVLGTPSALRSGFADGDAVVAHGHLDPFGATVFMAGPRFVLQSIEHRDG